MPKGLNGLDFRCGEAQSLRITNERSLRFFRGDVLQRSTSFFGFRRAPAAAIEAAELRLLWQLELGRVCPCNRVLLGRASLARREHERLQAAIFYNTHTNPFGLKRHVALSAGLKRHVALSAGLKRHIPCGHGKGPCISQNGARLLPTILSRLWKS